jgi:hypothetical protein
MLQADEDDDEGDAEEDDADSEEVGITYMHRGVDGATSGNTDGLRDRDRVLCELSTYLIGAVCVSGPCAAHEEEQQEGRRQGRQQADLHAGGRLRVHQHRRARRQARRVQAELKLRRHC